MECHNVAFCEKGMQKDGKQVVGLDTNKTNGKIDVTISNHIFFLIPSLP